jgi:eukaryotic translation initiation factor 2-alpha kinase 4
MNYFFSTGAERIAVIEDLRKRDIVFPDDWDDHRTRQRQSEISSIYSYLIH